MNDVPRALQERELVAWLTTTVRPQLDAIASSLREAFQGIRVEPFGGASGRATEFPAHTVGIEATLPSGVSVALSVTVWDLATTPRVLADVCWGAPRGVIEATTFEGWTRSSDWPLATPAQLAHVERSLPGLGEALRAAIARGVPGEG